MMRRPPRSTLFPYTTRFRSDVHRPLVGVTPKSLLRAKAAVSAVVDFTEQSFRPVLPDTGVGGEPLDASAVSKVLLCSGKVAYDLLAQRENDGTADTEIGRASCRERV